jgi:hypothetical protein
MFKFIIFKLNSRVSEPDAHVVGIASLQLVAQALVETNHLVATV